jgi:hypothetical protein
LKLITSFSLYSLLALIFMIMYPKRLIALSRIWMESSIRLSNFGSISYLLFSSLSRISMINLYLKALLISLYCYQNMIYLFYRHN